MDKRQIKDVRRQFTAKERFRYWFDNRMAKGSLSFIRILIVASILLAVLIAGIIILCGFHGDSEVGSVFWDSIATVINAWMPSYEDGSIGYILLMAVTAIAGVLFTSVLIGIVTSAIEDKITSLKKGNSEVLEAGHTVVLGFMPGEYTLLQQLVKAAAGEETCAVVADDLEREEMEALIRDNVEHPASFRFVCRTIDITDPVDLEKLAIDTAKDVIVAPLDDERTVKTILAVSNLTKEYKISDLRIAAILSNHAYRFPQTFLDENLITSVQTHDAIAKIIAHSCTQTALSQAFKEVFSFDGCEFYMIDVKKDEGLTFEDLTLRLDRAVPVGVCTENGIRLNPFPQYVLQKNDRIIVFAEESSDAVLTDRYYADKLPAAIAQTENVRPTGTVILGQNETLPLILEELPQNVEHVSLVLCWDEDVSLTPLEEIAERRGFTLEKLVSPTKKEMDLARIAALSDHIILLSDHKKPMDEADMDTIFLILHLRDLRMRLRLPFNITAEMCRESNQNLILGNDHTDFVVSSSMSSLFLAQIAENPELFGVFHEILSNEGNELFLKSASELHLTGKHTAQYLRRQLLLKRCILLGWLDRQKNSHFNPPLFEMLDIEDGDRFIVLSQD